MSERDPASVVPGRLAEYDLVAVVIAVRHLADAVRVGHALGWVQSPCADLRDDRVEVVHEQRNQRPAGAGAILLGVRGPIVGHGPDDLSRVREERGLTEEPLVPGARTREVADANPGEQREAHRRTVPPP